MTGTANILVLLVAMVSVAVSGLVLITTRSPTTALPVLLDLLLAAGLLRLSAVASWHAILAAAGLIAVRTVTSSGFRGPRRSRRRSARHRKADAEYR